MKSKNNLKHGLRVEVILAVLIGILLIGSLITENLISSSLTSYLIIAFILLKLFNTIKKGHHLFEEYFLLIILTMYILIKFYLKVETNSLINVIITLILLYSIGLMPKVKSLTKPSNVGPFIASYIFFVLIIIGLFAGFYDLNNTAFLENGKETMLSFSNSLYFSVISFTTVGYGDISPLGPNKIISSIEALIAIILNIAFLGYVFGSQRFHNHKHKN
jgi:hypothetical protein